MAILWTIGALAGVCALGLILIVLVSPGRPERNTWGWALRDRTHEHDLPITSWPTEVPGGER